jgi:hypothetical protein
MKPSAEPTNPAQQLDHHLHHRARGEERLAFRSAPGLEAVG